MPCSPLSECYMRRNLQPSRFARIIVVNLELIPCLQSLFEWDLLYHFTITTADHLSLGCRIVLLGFLNFKSNQRFNCPHPLHDHLSVNLKVGCYPFRWLRLVLDYPCYLKVGLAFQICSAHLDHLLCLQAFPWLDTHSRSDRISCTWSTTLFDSTCCIDRLALKWY